MPQPTSMPSELPILSIVYNSAEFPPVIINLFPDWEKTGETHISYINMGDLVRANDLLQFVQNAVADEIYDVDNLRGEGSASQNGDIPF